MSDGRVRRYRRGGLLAELRQQVIQVERQRDHPHPVAVGGPLPALARAVGVYLDPQAVGIAQVQRLGDAVVGGPLERPASPGDPSHALGERRAAGVQPGDVVEAGGARGKGCGRRDIGEHERRALGIGAQQCQLILAGDQRQAEYALIEVRAARQVADGECDGANAQIGVDRGHRSRR